MNGSGATTGAMLREHRRGQGISQARVAARIDAQQSQISRFEKGEVGILAPQKIAAYAQLVGVDPARLTAAAEPARPPCYCSDPACPGNLPFYVEGMVPVDTLPGEDWGYNEITRQIMGARSGRAFSIGDRLAVRLDRVDALDRKLAFSLASALPDAPRRSKNTKKH